jgi:hypothetical protein
MRLLVARENDLMIGLGNLIILTLAVGIGAGVVYGIVRGIAILISTVE